jgi:hypothetical protein
MSDLSAIAHEAVHLSELTGLSIGALAICVAVVVFLPPARFLAIGAAVVIVVSYGAGLYEHRVGRAEVTSEWAAADEAAAKAAAQRDQTISATLDAKYSPIIVDLKKHSATLQDQVASYEKQLLAAKSANASAGGACELGAAALRLRRQ